VLRDRQICDLEMILNGGFAPLNGFLNKDDYENVLNEMRLSDGSVWPMPITLDVNQEFSKLISIGDRITLKDKEGFSIAILEVEDNWEPDLLKESELVFGTKDLSHPSADYLQNHSNDVYIGGK
jgi:sulfate adenylyltransferase